MPLCSAHSCGTPLPRSAPCAARGGKSRDDFSSRNRLRIRIRYPQVSCLPEGKYLFFTIPRPIFTSCGSVGARAVNVFVKPSAEPNAVRAMPRRENEERSSTTSPHRTDTGSVRCFVFRGRQAGRRPHAPVETAPAQEAKKERRPDGGTPRKTGLRRKATPSRSAATCPANACLC